VSNDEISWWLPEVFQSLQLCDKLSEDCGTTEQLLENELVLQ